MRKIALLVGVSDYESELSQIPSACKDVEAIKQVLEHPDIGEFNEVHSLLNPDTQEMQLEIETIFSNSLKEDLIFLYFSGHGIKDESGQLYLASRITRKSIQGELIRSTAVSASFVRDSMNKGRSKKQIVVLDCCFSGAFAEGLLAKDDGFVNVKQQLGVEEPGWEGRAVLTSSTSTQYSFVEETPEENLSIYTRYLVEGIGTGAADLDGDHYISVDELHEYARRKVQEAAPAMKPEIYAVRQGYRLLLARTPVNDPKLRYRKEVESCSNRGEISSTGRRMLDYLRSSLELDPQEAFNIENEVLRPYRDYKQNLHQYEQAVLEAAQYKYPFSETTLNELNRYQKILRLRDEDVEPIRTKIIRENKKEQVFFAKFLQVSQLLIPTRQNLRAISLLISGLVIVSLVLFFGKEIAKFSSSLNQGNLKNTSLIYTFDEGSSPISAVAVDSSGRSFASAGHDKAIRMWNMSTGKPSRSPLYGHSEGVLSIALSSEGKILASGSIDNSIKVWDVDSGTIIRTLTTGGWVTTVAISPDQKTLVSGSSDNTIRVWDLSTGKQIRNLTQEDSSSKAPILSAFISPDGQTLASGGSDSKIRLWNLTSGKLISSLEGHRSWVSSVAISSDGKTLASASLDKTIKLWEIDTGKLLHTLDGHKYSVSSATFIPNTQFLVSGGFDGEIKTWNVQTGQLVGSFKGHSSQIASLATIKDVKTLISGGSDGKVKVWKIDP
jgi:WD40 repeat protein/uncharacterized caspase-like protein